MARFFIFQLLIVHSIIYAQSVTYQPISDEEYSFFNATEKYICPNDVRKSIEKYKNANIGWIGIIEEFSPDYDHEGNIIGIAYLVRHLYFNWKENILQSRKKICVFSYGEGYFACSKYTTLYHTEDEAFEAELKMVGEFILVYGTRPLIGMEESNEIWLEPNFIRFIDKDDVEIIGTKD